MNFVEKFIQMSNSNSCADKTRIGLTRRAKLGVLPGSGAGSKYTAGKNYKGHVWGASFWVHFCPSFYSQPRSHPFGGSQKQGIECRSSQQAQTYATTIAARRGLGEVTAGALSPCGERGEVKNPPLLKPWSLLHL